MSYITIAALGTLALSVSAFAGLVRSLIRQQARERDLMLNQIMHLAGRTWQQPPVSEPEPEAEPILVYSAEQDPDY